MPWKRPVKISPEELERFWAKVDRGKVTDCWLWTGSFNEVHAKGDSYGKMFRRGSGEGKEYTHRISWIIANKRQIPRGLHVLHKCNVKRCVNPQHLYVGTHAENMRDFRNTPKYKYRFAAKLKPEQVTELRKLVAAGSSYKEVAGIFGLAYSAVSPIVRREYWADVE